MKTAISIPDELFEAADNMARHMGLSRSELYRTALAAFLAAHAESLITEQLDAVHGATPAGDLDPMLARLAGRQPGPGRLVISRGEVWWAELADPRGSEPGLPGVRWWWCRPMPSTAVASALSSWSRSRRTWVWQRLPATSCCPAATRAWNANRWPTSRRSLTLDRRFLGTRVAALPPDVMAAIDTGLRLVLSV
jgi:hypothetical protein